MFKFFGNISSFFAHFKLSKTFPSIKIFFQIVIMMSGSWKLYGTKLSIFEEIKKTSLKKLLKKDLKSL